uniref:Protein-cysteine N-palmitoyltransferase HHAT-like protein n=1 Tax=Macrostomum lignano TaxID=282301 RepID=A0A1I8I3H8_9PLAT
MTMASTSSTANSVQTSGDLQGKEAEPIKRSAAASVSTSVPPSAGPRETLLYASVFAAAFGYAAGDFYLNIGRSPKKELHPMTLTNGWLSKWMERSFSLESDLKDGYKFLIFASVGFLLVSQVTIRLAPRWVHYLATTSFTLAVTAAILGYRTAMYFLVLHCGAVCMGYFSQFGVWLFILSAMMLQNSDYSSALFQVLDLEGDYSHLFYPISGYLYCRCISAGLSLNQMLRDQRRQPADEAQQLSLLQFLRLHLPRALAYGFYLPWHFSGPILTFADFCREAERPDRLVWKPNLLLLLAWRATRLLVWMLLLQVLHHFLPVGAFLESIRSYESVPYKRLVFSMYLHGQNFMLVYVQLYGWPGLVSSIDGVELPHWPDCISRVYTYRQMWRVFDRGLASFMYSHIYIPMGGSRHGIVRQVAAVAASFAFVSIYHGDSTSVRIWAALNALQLLLETLACAFYERKLKTWLSLILSPKNHQRLVAYIIGCNLILTSCFIFVFLMNTLDALWLVVEIFKPLLFYRPWWHLFLTLTLSYCSVQISLWYESRDQSKNKVQKDN